MSNKRPFCNLTCFRGSVWCGLYTIPLSTFMCNNLSSAIYCPGGISGPLPYTIIKQSSPLLHSDAADLGWRPNTHASRQDPGVLTAVTFQCPLPKGSLSIRTWLWEEGGGTLITSLCYCHWWCLWYLVIACLRGIWFSFFFFLFFFVKALGLKAWQCSSLCHFILQVVFWNLFLSWDHNLGFQFVIWCVLCSWEQNISCHRNVWKSEKMCYKVKHSV